MKRRTVITAIGTLAVGTGTVLGTGATEVLSSNEDGSFRVVSPGADISITVPDNPGSDVTTFPDAGTSDGNIDFEALEPDELPKVHVIDRSSTLTGDMVEIQVAVEADQITGLGNILDITNNNSDDDYYVGFEFTTLGTAVTDGGITEQEAYTAFQFKHGSSTEQTVSTDTSSDSTEPANYVAVSPLGTESVRLDVDTTASSIEDALSPGDFGNNSKSITLIDEVTAVATQTDPSA
ncbi:hypothetical protein [Haloferax sp. ATB1]|uniref:hypothetical protein n=1 Tax=Haloferax sp. ATB1 TaxID=1508454 RepID=UPI0005B22B31|nr:hypothetical protein [Haloferax sp. ATB1]